MVDMGKVRRRTRKEMCFVRRDKSRAKEVMKGMMRKMMITSETGAVLEYMYM
jgi:hypothetical protein